MLDSETKHRIDTARDILVGKVPDPKSQVEQITIALIYKFMDDMDAEAEELGGKRKFFAKEFARYGWAKLMHSGLGGHETLNLYAEAISKMPENPGIPPLFRDIFKNAYLPYRDPETLRAFLKIIDEFEYDHSERLGDAYEYLLSVLGTQGKLGQLRTQRHIIDFIVEIVDPKKTESILDPACGSSGFLISSFKHILKANIDKNGHSTLTPDERGRLASNLHGYDIDPGMVRLSLVNMYLHGFTDPHIYEYDTLTSQDRWGEYADVILANPPFMSPKGGIKPHNRFSLQSKRSEVLFVDYIAEHLTSVGRAGIIVPEGVIFQSQNAHTQLRRMLVEDFLVAVVSLPAGAFNPYSGVKTSILILDKALAKQTDHIALFMIENDGYDLGAQRRPIDKDDLPQARTEIAEYMRRLHARESVEDFKPTLGLIVPKKKIAANGDYNLSRERYREADDREASWPKVELGSIFDFVGKGQRPAAFANENGPVPFYVSSLSMKRCNSADFDMEALIIGDGGSANIHYANGAFSASDHIYILRSKDNAPVVIKYVYYMIHANLNLIEDGFQGQGLKNVSKKHLLTIQIPLPPLDVQKVIVAEIDGYQKVIDGARAIIDNYHPHIPINPDWPLLCFEDAPFKIIDGDRGTNYPKKEDFSLSGYCLFLNTKNVRSDGFNFSEMEFISKEKDNSLKKGRLSRGDVVLTTRGTIGNTGLYDESVTFNHIRINSGMLIFRPDATQISGSFLFHFFQSENFRKQREAIVSGSAQPQLPIRSLNKAMIPIPPLTTQQAIVAEIEAEQALVAANRELIMRFEKKIQATLSRVWGEKSNAGEMEEA